MLRPVRTVTAADAIAVGEQLQMQSTQFVEKLFAVLTAQRNCPFKLSRPRLDLPASARINPVITIEFPPIEYTWHEHKMEFRICIAACFGDRQPKIWTRHSFFNEQTDSSLVAKFFRDIPEFDSRIHSFCVPFYNSILSSQQSNIAGTDIDYKAHIRMISENDRTILERVDNRFDADTKISLREENDRNSISQLADKLRREYHFDIPADASSLITRGIINCKYLKTDAWDIPQQSETHSTNKIQIRPEESSLASQEKNWRAVCLVDIAESLEVTGIAYEPNIATTFHRSASHIVSGELSYEIGKLY